MDFKDLAVKRYSVRAFAERPVEEEKLKLVLEACRNSPTAKNLQSQTVFVAKNPETVERIGKCCGCYYPSPVVLIVAYKEEYAWTRETDGMNFGRVDATIAATQMMLQAADIGLGTTFVAFFEEEKLKKEFPVLEEMKILAVLPLGYPAEDAEPAPWHTMRRPLEKVAKYI